MKNVSALALGLALLVLAACQPAGQTLPEERLTAFEKAFNAGDAASIAAFYAEDATLMPPNAPAVKGRAAIEQYMREALAQGPTRFSVATDENFTSGGAGIHRGTFRVTTPEGQEIGRASCRERVSRCV